jgi:fibronectin type 3 domain-containing protein
MVVTRLHGICAGAPPEPPAVIWQAGKADDSSAEFGQYRSTPVERLTANAGGEVTESGGAISRGLRADRDPAMEITYDLPEVPGNGVLFSFKLLNAPKSGAQMAVFSNHRMAGLVQLWGTAGTSSPYRWLKTYRLYVPKEMLVAGPNVLRLEAALPMWCKPDDANVRSQTWWEWDYLKLETLAAPAPEPIHGTVCYLGTTLKHSADDFLVDDDVVRLAPEELQWLGIAYSGNSIRCDFWFDVAHLQPRRLEYLKLLRDLNMSAVVDNVGPGHFHNGPDGRLPEKMKLALDQFFSQYGSLFQYYELGNEPCMFGGGYAEAMELARYIDRIKPATVKLAACGWAYGGGKGTPTNWDASAALRANIEALCQSTNGHSYGYSYADNRGGSFVENLATFGGVEDGWPVDSMTTETGTNNWHSEENGTHFQSSQPNAQAFDRILRAHFAVVERTMQHAAIFDDFGLFQAPANWSDPATFSAYPGQNGQDTRLKTYRRLALAYATHGAPLGYECLNPAETADQRVYFRAVDTAALAALPGSGATSNKILLNFVNFDTTPHRMSVRVNLPRPGDYAGERFGPGDSYAAAHSSVTLHAGPAVEITESLGGGECVQYILTPPGTAAPYPPRDVRAEAGDGQVSLNWRAVAGASGYEVQRSIDSGPPATVAGGVTETHWVDPGPKEGNVCRYTVRAVNAAGKSGESAIAEVRAGGPDVPGAPTATAGDGQVTLTWPAAARATAYRVERADRLAGPFTTVADHLTEARFSDANTKNGSAYFYVIHSANAVSESAGPAVLRAVPHPPPAAPGELAAVSADHRVVLHWKAADATEYLVRRADASTGTFKTLVAGLMTGEYHDDDVQNGKSYQYIVAAGDPDAGEAAASAPVVAAPAAQPLPGDWKQADIGKVGRPGFGTTTPAPAREGSTDAVFTVQGAGDDVWGNADALHLVYMTLPADGIMTCHVVAFDESHEWAKIGLMARSSLDPDAAMAMMALTPSHGCSFTHRDKVAGACLQDGAAGHAWLRLSREQNRITGSVSDDGQSWKKVAAAELAGSGEIFVGLGVCSHTQGRTNRAVFDQVTLTK